MTIKGFEINLKNVLVGLALLILAVAGIVMPINTTPTPAEAPAGASRGMTNLSDLTVRNLTASGDATITGALTANGVITDSGHLTMTYITGTTSISTGALGVTGASTLTGLTSANGGLHVSVPTAAASATPAAIVNNTGANNDALVVNKVVAGTATPVFKISNAGAVTGYLLQYGTQGQKIVCSSTTITGTGYLATGLATPAVVIADMGADANYDHGHVSVLNASATVTAKIWNGAATPVAAATGVPVNWCAIGTP